MAKQALKTLGKTTTPKTVSNQNVAGNVLVARIEKYSSQIFLGLVCLMSIVVFFKYLTFQSFYLFKDIGSDTLNIAFPAFKSISEYLRSYGTPKWSFNMGMGQDMFPFCLSRDPFAIFLYILGPDNFASGIIFVEVAKVILGGWLFYRFLQLIDVSKYASIVGGLLFSFSGFVILGSCWYVFTTEAFYGVLLLLAFERFFVKGSWWLFPVSIAIIGISMPFNLYPIGLFLLMYSFVRYVENNGFEWKGYFLLMGKLALLSVLGLGLSSVFLFSNILQLLESPRVSGSVSYFDKLFSQPTFAFADAVHNKTAAMRLFGNDMLGTGTNFKGWQNYLEAPLFYCGIVSLLLLTQAFGSFSRIQKILYGSLLAIWLLPIIFPFFRYAFWLFTGDYYRIFSFFVSFTVVLLGVKALSFIDRKAKVNLLVLGLTLVGVLILLYFPYTKTSSDINKGLRTFATFLLFVYALLIYLSSNASARNIAKVSLLVLTCFELIYFSSITVNKRSVLGNDEYYARTGYNDYTKEAIEYIKKIDKSFYRIDKYYSSGPAVHASINDAMSQGYYGTSSYNSFNQMNYINFLSATNVIRPTNEFETRWAPGIASRPLLENICSVKYILTKQKNAVNLTQMFNDSIAMFGDVKVYRKRFVQPMGVAYSSYITMEDFSKLSPTQKDFTLLRACVVDSGDTELKSIKRFTLADTLQAYTWDQVAAFTSALKADSLSMQEHDQNHFKGSINLIQSGVLFFSIPFDGGWKASVDGVETPLHKVNAGFTGLALPKGKHEVLLSFEPRMVKKGLLITSLSLLVFIGLLAFEKLRKKPEVTVAK